MHTTETRITVADYCDAMKRGEISVNHEYQRSGDVWPATARSFLIETILLGYPIPKLSLHQITDVKTRTTRKEIVDGQQRSTAILDYFNNEFALSQKLLTAEVAGKRYDDLPDAYQHKFLSYSLSCDLFIAAADEEIRDSFRRINSYTVPLNPQEIRHAIYQGPFKWFIYHLAKGYDEPLMQMGVFSQRDIIRMHDAKLYTEVCHALLHGIRTTTKHSLDHVYRDNNVEFPLVDEFEERFDFGLRTLIAWDALRNGPLMKPYAVYSLLLAMMHMHKEAPMLTEAHASLNLDVFNEETALQNLATLAAALEAEDAEGEDESAERREHKAFVKACESATNTAANRVTRFQFFCRALEPRLL